MTKRALKFVILSFSASGSFAFANSAKTNTTSQPQNALTIDDYRCGRDQGISLSDFKEKLFENCDLTKPFSTSLSRVLNDDTYFYCCQKKK